MIEIIWEYLVIMHSNMVSQYVLCSTCGRADGRNGGVLEKEKDAGGE